MPFTGEFQPKFPPAIDGGMQIDITDTTGVLSGYILDVEKDWHLTVEVNLSGMLVPYLTGKLHIHAYLESIGFGPEGTVVEDNDIAMNGACCYTRMYAIGPSQPASQEFYDSIKTWTPVPNKPPKPAYGAYKLVVVATTSPVSGLPGPIAAYVEGPVLQLYKDETD